MATLRKKTEDNVEQLRSLGYSVIEMWEHDFLLQKKEDVELKTFLLTHNLQDRLNPRDAFFGGRTNAVKLYHEGNTKYVDFTSLYPWVSMLCITFFFHICFSFFLIFKMGENLNYLFSYRLINIVCTLSATHKSLQKILKTWRSTLELSGVRLFHLEDCIFQYFPTDAEENLCFPSAERVWK